jgi:replicative DNA helicase
MTETELPRNIDAERALLGSMTSQGFFDPTVMLSADDFYLDSHRKIYLAMADLQEAGDPTDFIAICDALKAKGQLEAAGGMGYIAGLGDGVPGPPNLFPHWERIIHECAIRRRFMKQADALARIAASEEFSTLAHGADCLSRILAEERTEASAFVSLEAIAEEYRQFVRHIDELSLRTGIKSLDHRTGGIQLGEVLTLLARTAVGKSAIAQNVVANVLRAYPDAGVCFFSLEMPRTQAFERQIQIYARATRGEVIRAFASGREGDVGATQFVSDCRDRLAIIDEPRLSVTDMERRVKALVSLNRIKPVRLVVIDYLGYIGGGAKNESVTDRISRFAREVKELAKSLRCVVLLISQTSRSAGDGSEEVSLTDARDSGVIEDSADFLIGCWRPELATDLVPDEFAEVQGLLWFRILKSRRGMQDKFSVRFEGETVSVLDEQTTE